MVADTLRQPQCSRQSHAFLFAIFAAALVLVTLTHLRSTTVHEALAVLRNATTHNSPANIATSGSRIASPPAVAATAAAAAAAAAAPSAATLQSPITTVPQPNSGLQLAHSPGPLLAFPTEEGDEGTAADEDDSDASPNQTTQSDGSHPHFDANDEASEETPATSTPSTLSSPFGPPPLATHAPAAPVWLPPNATALMADLDAFACHFFQNLDVVVTNNDSSWELQQPAVLQLLAVLRRLRPQHRCSRATDADAGTHSDSTTMGTQPAALIAEMPSKARAALSTLHLGVGLVKQAACDARGPTDPQRPPGGFAAMRRLTLAVMQQLWAEQYSGGAVASWRAALEQAAPKIIAAFKSAHACGAAQRPIMELFHVSKSGGTSACQLARSATRRAQRFDQGGNCMQQHFGDEPRWMTYPDFRPPKGFARCNWVLNNCTQWLLEPEVSCDARQEALTQLGLDFFSNEHALHGSTTHPGSSHTCPQFESLVVLRDPLLRAEAHIIEIIRTYIGNFQRKCARTAAERAQYVLPRTLKFWARFAPSAVDNYNIRSLLGKHFHCVPFGSLTTEHLHHAQLKLLSFDYITVLEEDAYNDVIFRLGMGWPETLRLSHLRWGEDYSDARRHHADPKSYDLRGPGSRIEGAGGFPPGSSRRLGMWNALDGQLLALGKAALLLDAQFFSTAAIYDLQVRPSQPPPPAAKWRQEAGMPKSIPQSVRMMVQAGKLQWSAKSQHFLPRPDVVIVLPLPVDPDLVLFNALALLSSSSSWLHESAGSAAPEPGGTEGLRSGVSVTGLEFVCPDSSLNGTRKVWSATRARLKHHSVGHRSQRPPALQINRLLKQRGSRAK